MAHKMADGKKKSELRGDPLFKVLDLDFQSFHGGDTDYSPYLPSINVAGVWIPGEWTEEIPDPVLCQTGYHLTNEPYDRWGGNAGLVFYAEGHHEYDDGGRGKGQTDSDKISFSQVRLLRPDSRTATKLQDKILQGIADPTGVTATATAVNSAKRIADELIAAPFLAVGSMARIPTGTRVFGTKAEADYMVKRDSGAVGLYAQSRAYGDPYNPTKEESAQIATEMSRLDAHARSLGYKESAFPTQLLKLAVEAESLPASSTRRSHIEFALNAHKLGYGISGRSGSTLYLYRSL